jgi:hypothetical protein
MLPFLKRYSNSALATIALLRLLKVKVTNETINTLLENHPDYPSLLSINDVLPQFNLKTFAIDADKKRIYEFPLPFLAHIITKGGMFVTVTNIKDNKLSYYDNSTKQKVITTDIENFNTIWSGKALLVESHSNAGEADYVNKKKKQFLKNNRIPFLLVCLLLLGILMIINSFVITTLTIALPYCFLAFFHYTGIIVTSLLLWYEVDKTNTTLQEICTAGGKTNCNAILNSKHAKFLGWLSWSEIGFYYFTGSYLSLIIIGIGALPLLALLSFLSLPYVAFSIYYQWRVAKQWCMLCLSVQGLLLMLGIINVLSFQFTTSFSVNTVSQLIIAFITPIAIWSIFKPGFLKSKDLEPKARELARLKANPVIFESLLVKQKKITQNIRGLGILLGNPNASNMIVKVCNPYCGPCSKVHQLLEDILHDSPNVNLQVLFTATLDENDKRNKPVKHLLALQQLKGQAVVAQAMDDWYSLAIKDYEVFADKYPIDSSILELQNKNIADMKNWCDEIDIQYTPTFFINGYQLPEIYNIDDIKYMFS